jgi:PAS domain S-box-containing protein
VSKSSGERSIGVDEAPVAEPHLRAVLETQPVILIRLAKDGTFLAVNEGGVSALGAERLDQLLGTSLAALLRADDRNSLLVFLEKITAGNRGSTEIELTGLTGTRHTMQLHAAPHPGAPDGIDSLLATLRDVTESRKLEQSLVQAMARQTEQEAAHEAERARLAAELAEARSLGHAAETNEIAALERKLAEAAELRSQLTTQHAAEIEGLTEALDERTRISDEQAARLTEAAANEARWKAELAEAVSRHEAAIAEGTAAREALEAARESAAAAVQEVTVRFEADVQALKDALNQAMEDQAQLAQQAVAHEKSAAAHEQSAAAHEQSAAEARARVEELERAIAELQQSTGETIRGLESRVAALDQDLAAATAAQQELEREHQSRFGQLEAALAAARDAERRVASRFATLAEAANRVAQEARLLASTASAGAGISAQALATRIEQPLKDVLGRDVALTLAVASPDSVISAPPDRVEQALIALAVNRGATMRSGQIVLEIADVNVDSDAARGRGGMSPGAYVLAAVHVAGDGAADGLPNNLFESSDTNAWSRAEAELAGAHEVTRASGGTLWLAREGKGGVVFELYLRRQAAEAQ